MKTYKLKIKERNNDSILTPSYTSCEELTEKFLENFFGLNQPDVEWYEITVIEDEG